VEVVTSLDLVEPVPPKRTQARETDDVEPVPEAHRRAVLLKAPKVIRDMIRVQTFCGCRPGERCALRRGDIDTSGDTWIATVRQHKGAWRENSTPVEIGFGRRCQRILRPYMLRPADAYLFDPREAISQRAAAADTHRRQKQRPTPRRTKRRVQDHYTTASYRRAIHRLCAAAGVPQWSPHQLRKNAATRVREKLGPDEAQIVLGHKSMKTTEIYARLKRERLAEIMDQIG
jgi:integrase